MNLTDTHCHLYFRDYQHDLPEVISRATENGVKRILVPAIDLDSSKAALQLAENHESIFVAIGIHPNSAKMWGSDTLSELIPMLAHPKVVAIGEIGLDYYRDKAPRNLQKKILQKQLELAEKNKLPVILHVRNKTGQDRSCIEDLLSILENWLKKSDPSPDKLRNGVGVVHSFSGDTKEGNQAIDLGFYIGVTGSITFKNADMVKQVVQNIPLSKLLIETDGPFITPHPYRGRRNEPAHVRYIVDKISEIIGVSPDQVADQTTENATRLFQWE